MADTRSAASARASELACADETSRGVNTATNTRIGTSTTAARQAPRLGRRTPPFSAAISAASWNARMRRQNPKKPRALPTTSSASPPGVPPSREFMRRPAALMPMPA